MILSALAAGAAVGAGVLLTVRGLFAPPPPLGRRLACLYEAPPADALAAVRSRGQGLALRALGATGADVGALARDLALCETALERHAVARLGFAVAGAGLPVAVAVTWAVAGISVAPGAVALVAAAAAVGGFVLPDALVARRAAGRRRDLRYALALFLDLVVIVLAGGGGVETALHRASGAGEGWAFARLRRALATARLQRSSPWAALRALGEDTGSSDLVELASAVELAGTSGARVRESLRARATSARDHELAHSEAAALADSERMGAPMVAMFVGLILLIGYPAMATVLAL